MATTISLTQGDKLSQRQTRDGGGRSMNNEAAVTFDKQLKELVPNEILSTLKKLFPNLEFKYEKKLSQEYYAKIINPNYKPSSDKSFISPDGGFVYVKIKGIWVPVLITEAKKQGTNDKREAEGKCKQAMGNAIERAHKNYNELKEYMSTFNQKYFPYLIFAYGCDFKDGSTIRDRLAAMTRYQDYNQFNILNDGYHQRATIFIQTERFSDQYIIDKCIEAVSIVINELFPEQH